MTGKENEKRKERVGMKRKVVGPFSFSQRLQPSLEEKRTELKDKEVKLL